MNTPLVSVIIPSYNREKTIERSIRSVLEQTYSNLELIVVDDGSTDHTQEIIRSIKDPRLMYYKQPIRSGACAARNKGVEVSKGNLIAFQDSDDVWHKDKLERQLQFILKSDYDFTYTGLLQYYPNHSVRRVFVPCSEKKEDAWQQLLARNWISTQTILCYKYCFDKIRFDTQLKRLQDWDLALQAAKFFKIGGLSEYLVDAYIQSDSITNQEKLNVARYILLDKQLSFAQKQDKRVLAEYHRIYGRAFRSTQSTEAAMHYWKSFKLVPKFSTFLMSVLAFWGIFKYYRDCRMLCHKLKY